MIVEPPGANLVPQRQNFRRALRIGDPLHHALEGLQMTLDNFPFTAIAPNPHHSVAALHQERGRTQLRSVPDAFAFDFGVLNSFP
jgi:hypothetical protein